MSYNKIVESNRELFNKTDQLKRLKTLFDDINQTNLSEDEINKNIKKSNVELNEYKVQLDKSGQDIALIKESEDFKKDTITKEKRNAENNLLDYQMQSVKQQLNLKYLAKLYHHDKKKIELINLFNNNFRSALGSERNSEFIDLVRGAYEIEPDSLKELQSKLIESSITLTTRTDEKINSIEKDIKTIENKIANHEKDLLEDSKKADKLKNKKEQLIMESITIFKILFPNIEII